MKKIFRMQYEPCLGTCYEYDDILMQEITKLKDTPENLKRLLSDLKYIHDKTCGDVSLGFILDYDENVFIGNFIHHEGSQAFVGKNINDVFSKFARLVEWYGATNYIEVNKDACDHGRDDNIIQFTLDKAGLTLDTII